MSRYTGPVCKLCRREGQKLYLKGDKCYTNCTLEKKPMPPGMHTRDQASNEYGLQLREKQKARRFYRVGENQFRLYYQKAFKVGGVTGETLMQFLERRLDNVVYRAGFARSRAEARQIVNHGHVAVNGRKVDIPSYLVDPGDEISIRPRSLKMGKIQGYGRVPGRSHPSSWISLDPQNWKAVFLEIAGEMKLMLLWMRKVHRWLFIKVIHSQESVSNKGGSRVVRFDRTKDSMRRDFA